MEEGYSGQVFKTKTIPWDVDWADNRKNTERLIWESQNSKGSVENKPGWSNLIMIQSYKIKIVIINIQFSICWIFWLENSLESKEANETSLARLWKSWICKILEEEQMWALNMPTGGMKRQLDKGKVPSLCVWSDGNAAATRTNSCSSSGMTGKNDRIQRGLK